MQNETLQPIRAVLFDFDGTLADTLPLSFFAFREVFLEYTSKDYSNEELVALFGPTEDGIIMNVLKDHDAVQEAISSYYRIYEERHDEMLVLSGDIYSMLTELHKLRIPMGIITGKSRKSLNISTDKLYMTPYFSVHYAGDELLRPKPDREGIDRAVASLGVKPAETLFIGDSNADMAAGRSGGTITGGAQWFEAVQNKQLYPEPDYVFQSPEQVVELVKESLKDSH